jgi:aminoglycoside phosphotransferase (APT) family kinase protein
MPLTRELLNDALHDAGVLAPERCVTGFEAQCTEGGRLAETVRLLISYDGDANGAPRSLIAKSPAVDEQARAIAGWLGLYDRELQFYRTLGPALAMRIPRCYLAERDPDGETFSLVLEDIAGATVHDQDEGCPVADARLALGEAAQLHVAHWNDAGLSELSWLNQLSPEQLTGFQELYRYAWPKYLERDGVALAPELCDVGDQLSAADLVSWVTRYDGPRTLTHADFHLTNLLFAEDARGRREVVTVDWQMAMHATPLIDVAYFVGRLPTETRRDHERELVRGYHDRLLDAGVTGYSWPACWEDYQRAVWYGLLSAVGASAAYETSGVEAERYLRKVTRYLVQARDHESLRFLG